MYVCMYVCTCMYHSHYLDKKSRHSFRLLGMEKKCELLHRQLAISICVGKLELFLLTRFDFPQFFGSLFR